MSNEHKAVQRVKRVFGKTCEECSFFLPLNVGSLSWFWEDPGCFYKKLYNLFFLSFAKHTLKLETNVYEYGNCFSELSCLQILIGVPCLMIFEPKMGILHFIALKFYTFLVVHRNSFQTCINEYLNAHGKKARKLSTN